MKQVKTKMDKFQTEKRRKLIEDYVNSKPQVGQLVDIDAEYLNASYTRGMNDVTITKIFPDGKFEVRNTSYHPDEYYGKPTIIDPETVPFEMDPLFIGVNPFTTKNWMQCCRHTGLGLGHIVFKIEEMMENGNVGTEIDGIKVMEYNFSPYVYDKNGNKLYFQRDYCWTLEDEQNFIESIYNYLNLGTIVLRKRSYKWVEKQCKAGNTEAAFYDIIDGKQRIHTLMRFMKNEFPDLHGNYYGDFSEYARRIFSMDVQGLDVMEINEGATDEDVLRVFLNVNYSGKPMSREHLDYVKSLYNNIINESDSNTNENCEIVKFDKKHAYCDCSFYYGYYIKTSMKVLKSILGRPQHIGSDECEWNSSSVEWWKMLKISDSIIPFKLYDYNYANALDDKDAIVYWRIGTEKDKKEEQEIVQKYLLNLINNNK